MLKCSHGLPYESKCQGCFQDAMRRVSAGPIETPKVTPERRDEFWLAAFGQTPDQPKEDASDR